MSVLTQTFHSYELKNGYAKMLSADENSLKFRSGMWLERACEDQRV